MFISSENRKLEWIVTIQSIILMIITITTFILSEQRSNWLCGPATLFFELIALVIQTILNIWVWMDFKYSIKIFFSITSLIILLLVIAGFLQFYFHCS